MPERNGVRIVNSEQIRRCASAVWVYDSVDLTPIVHAIQMKRI